jgi:hypothetical protein
MAVAPAEFSTGVGNSRILGVLARLSQRPSRRCNLSRVHELSIAIDLGRLVVLTSVPEGKDKPLKYPTIFNRADVVVITKCDLGHAGATVQRRCETSRRFGPASTCWRPPPERVAASMRGCPECDWRSRAAYEVCRRRRHGVVQRRPNQRTRGHVL